MFTGHFVFKWMRYTLQKNYKIMRVKQILKLELEILVFKSIDIYTKYGF